ncbi:MAG: YihA family ribosome biogenesis GTP-binding protein [Candidatus Aminicenantes bacterium]|nr:YihA family ribosome biogenesis GTP-binding protein [Candidatus Aminicenantes bacterium]
MNITDVKLFRTAFQKKEIILDRKQKVIFMGRSNVGKSTFINSLCDRKNLARTSSKPGKTISINYYLINEKFYFVDLPGHGYAKISKRESQRVKMLIYHFFEKIDRVALVIILIDSRRGFMNSDIELLSKIINKNYNILTVLTKSDKISYSHLLNQTTKLQEEFDLYAIPFSIKSAQNKYIILDYIEKALLISA